VEQAKPDRAIVLYSRVSSAKQRNDLERQQEYLKSNLPHEHSGQKVDLIEVYDIGSGINFKRPGLLRVLGLVKSGRVSKLVVASKDRLARFGFELIEWICREFQCEIIFLDHQDGAPEEELGKDLMAIVQVYCCRWNGRRCYKNREETTPSSSQAQVEPIGTTEKST
jgi:predicted site-specific integrase-resolvase